VLSVGSQHPNGTITALVGYHVGDTYGQKWVRL
jgi:hypothetical protein